MATLDILAPPRDWRLVSEAEFLTLQEDAEALAERDPDAPRGYELLDGRLVPMSPTGVPQGRAWVRAIQVLADYITDSHLGDVFADTLVYLDNDGQWRVYPDLSFIAAGSATRVVSEHIEGPPTLALEITTRRSLERDTVSKMAAYHRFRVPWYWIVNLVTEEWEEHRWAEAAYDCVSRTPLDAPFVSQLFPDLTIALRP